MKTTALSQMQKQVRDCANNLWTQLWALVSKRQLTLKWKSSQTRQSKLSFLIINIKNAEVTLK